MRRNIYATERDVKEALNIESFRNITKEKIMEFVSMIPNMDKEVAINCIKQFPHYSNMVIALVREYKEICESIIEASQNSNIEVIKSYQIILLNLEKKLNKTDITSEEYDKILEQMFDIADKISAKDTEQKKFLLDIAKMKASIISGGLIFGLVFLGVKFKGVNLPKIGK